MRQTNEAAGRREEDVLRPANRTCTVHEPIPTQSVVVQSIHPPKQVSPNPGNKNKVRVSSLSRCNTAPV